MSLLLLLLILEGFLCCSGRYQYDFMFLLSLLLLLLGGVYNDFVSIVVVIVNIERVLCCRCGRCY